MDSLLQAIDVSAGDFAILSAIAFGAGLVRGFSGFALSALVMASAVYLLPPIELIPICWWLEMSASVLMARGGWKEADRGVVLGLVIGSTAGVPLGLMLTQSLPVETSKLIALVIIIALAATQLAKIRLAFLATRPGLYLSGLTAGIATGLASVGGMVVALYVLSQDAPARKMRAALVLFLFISSLTSMIYLVWFGVMDMTSVWRGAALAIPAMIGVFAGQRLFTPKYEPYYRPFCLALLISLSAIGLVRTSLA
ncbi:sulfite exporter TauE/SafE family protein [Yoonia sp. 208BN28-4]|uniref:sulfite exporter TauE/SafE family protein n=1 Tax=Yoonia sp. 208BN28-4 TaxID=3126505 RepID=UPI0030AB2DBA